MRGMRDRKQIALLPECVDDYIGQDNAVSVCRRSSLSRRNTRWDGHQLFEVSGQQVGLEAATEVMHRLDLIRGAVSLGDVETLISDDRLYLGDRALQLQVGRRPDIAAGTLVEEDHHFTHLGQRASSVPGTMYPSQKGSREGVHIAAGQAIACGARFLASHGGEYVPSSDANNDGALSVVVRSLSREVGCFS
ncbi:hypothetical protein P0D88_47645 [Paraburkholderia sp. RL18-103-BIB-C]|jgi:hypothetical protein|uniref:hypothetical protein n=1 Tax=unclassified Paraburkholderia TaxID=2615204 RepID=UPI0038BA057F